MQIEYIDYTHQFQKQYEKLPLRIKKSLEGKEIIFRNDVFDARLRAHKLHGKESPH